MKNLRYVLVLLFSIASPAIAEVSEAEFSELKIQMLNLAERVRSLEIENARLRGDQDEHLVDEQTPASANQPVAKIDRKGFNIASPDSEYAIKIGTRLHAEGSTHSGDLPAGVDPNNGFELRRARIETKGTLDKNWNWVAEVDLADNKVSLKDFWLGYKTQNGTKLSFGHQKQPFNLSLEMSSNDIPFIERSVDNYLVSPFMDRAIGFRAENSGANWFAAAGVFGESVSPNATTGDEGWGLTGRFVYSPVIKDNQVLHLGVRAATRRMASNSQNIRINDETTHLSSLRIVDTGQLNGIESVDLLGAEAAYALGAFSIVGEYNTLNSNGNGVADADFDSWSIYSTWSLTGESRASSYRIDSGEFKRLTPASNFDAGNGTWGAWEIAIRYADINLNDALIVGGEESVFTSALNWYPNTNIRFMLEWSHIVDTDDSTPLRQSASGLDIYQFRTQYTF